MPRLLSSIVFLFLTLILALFLLLPQYQRLRNLQIEIKVKKTEIENQENYLKHLNDLSEKLKKYQPEISKIDSTLPPRPDLPSLLHFLQKASSQNGLVFKDLGTFSIILPKKLEGPVGEMPKASPEFKEISLDFGVSGSYSALKNFLSTLEKSARLILVESLSFSVEKEETPSFKLKIKTFSY